MHMENINKVIELRNERNRILDKMQDASAENCSVIIGRYIYTKEIADAARKAALEILRENLKRVEGQLLELGVVCHKISGDNQGLIGPWSYTQ